MRRWWLDGREAALRGGEILFGVSFILLCVFPSLAKADCIQNWICPGEMTNQGFTGPLYAPSGALSTAHLLSVEPYLIFSRSGTQFGSDGRPKRSQTISTSYESATLVKYSVFRWMSVQMIPTFSYTTTRARAGGRIAGGSISDLPIDASFRIPRAKPSWWPDASLFVGASLPVGAYSRLDNADDAGGLGVAGLHFMATTQSNFTIASEMGLRIRTWWSERIYPGRAHFSGVNAYVSVPVWDGIARPPRATQFGSGFEFAFDIRWVLAVDILHDRTEAARAAYMVSNSGGGHSMHHDYTSATAETLVAPAVEYNWSPFSGIIAGFATSLSGVNSPTTFNVQLAYSHVF